jgi:hypothetical protein
MFGWMDADVQAPGMDTGSNVTNAANVTNQSSSNQFTRSINRPIQRVLSEPINQRGPCCLGLFMSFVGSRMHIHIQRDFGQNQRRGRRCDLFIG